MRNKLRNRLPNKILITHFFIVAIIVNLIFLHGMIPVVSDQELILFSCYCLILVTAWILFSWKKVFGGIFNPYGLFIISIALFNSGQVYLEVIGANKNGLMSGRYSFAVLLSTLWIIIVAILSLHAGALLAFLKNRKPSPDGEKKYDVKKLDVVKVMGIFLLSISFVPSALNLIQSIQLVMSGGYFSLYQQDKLQGVENIPFILSNFLVCSAFYLLIAGLKNKIYKFISLVIIVLYSVIQLGLGARSAAMMPLVAYAWLWDQYIAPLRRTTVIGVSALLFLVVFPLIAATRDFGGSERLSFNSVVDSYLSVDNPAVAILSEMGATMGPIAGTIERVPATRNFDYGGSYFYAVRFLTPNSIWADQPEYASLSQWYVWNEEPVFAKFGGGLGYSFIAESYLNFGWFGVVIICSLTGYGIALMSIAGSSGNILKSIFVASFLAFMLVLPRAETLLMMRPLIWYSAIPYAICQGLSATVRKRRRHSSVAIRV